jgi:hypothetical protein
VEGGTESDPQAKKAKVHSFTAQQLLELIGSFYQAQAATSAPLFKTIEIPPARQEKKEQNVLKGGSLTNPSVLANAPPLMDCVIPNGVWQTLVLQQQLQSILQLLEVVPRPDMGRMLSTLPQSNKLAHEAAAPTLELPGRHRDPGGEVLHSFRSRGVPCPGVREAVGGGVVLSPRVTPTQGPS